MDNVENVDALLTELEALTASLPASISADEVKHHEWLRRLILVAHDISGRTDPAAFAWIDNHDSRSPG